MYTYEEGFKVTVFHTARNKQYNFTKLGSKSYVENELKDLGFPPQDIAAATYTQLTLKQIKQHIKEIDDAWDNY
jgi:hypothetical protein